MEVLYPEGGGRVWIALVGAAVRATFGATTRCRVVALSRSALGDRGRFSRRSNFLEKSRSGARFAACSILD